MPNKQKKSSKNIAKSPLSVGLPLFDDERGLEFLLHHSQMLWRESSYEKLLARFIEIGKEIFPFKWAEVCSVRLDGKKVSLEPCHFDFNQHIARMPEDLLVPLEAMLATVNLKTMESRQGLNILHAHGCDFYFILLGDPAADWQILVWALSDLVSDKVKSSNSVSFCDFLSRQLQSASVWFQRLDKTQALLYRDDLTGVFNSRYLELSIDGEIRRGQRFQTAFCLLFIDLDNFKSVNDRFGHLVGSQVLKQLADVLREVSREVDSVIRYGGDEFIIILLGASATAGVLAGERIRRKIEKTEFLTDTGTESIHLTASIGVAAYPDHAKDREGLLKLADEMMYQSKKLGKNKVSIAVLNKGAVDVNVVAVKGAHTGD